MLISTGTCDWEQSASMQKHFPTEAVWESLVPKVNISWESGTDKLLKHQLEDTTCDAVASELLQTWFEFSTNKPSTHFVLHKRKFLMK